MKTVTPDETSVLTARSFRIAGTDHFDFGYAVALGVIVILTAAGAIFALVAPAAQQASSYALILGAALVCVVTCIALLKAFAPSREARSAWALAIGLVAAVVFALITFALTTLKRDPTAPTAGVAPTTAILMYLVWHALETIGVTSYLIQRGALPRRVRTGAIAILWSTTLIGLAILEWTVAFAPQRLPELIRGASFQGLRDGGAGVLLLIVIIVTALFAARISAPTGVDRAVVLMQVALAVGLVANLLGGDFYSPSAFCARMLQLCGLLFVLVAALQAHAATRDASRGLIGRSTLGISGARIDALRQMAAIQDTDQERRFSRMLEIATSTIRPGKPLRGTLSHLDEGRLLYDAVALVGAEAWDMKPDLVLPGAVVPFEKTVQSIINTDGTARAWSDIAASDIAGQTFASTVGSRGVIGSSVLIGRRTYFIVYSSPEAMTEYPFTEADLSYVDVVASIFASTFNQYEFIDRLRHQMEHDALTGLENRVQFRKALRSEIARSQPFGVAFVNIDNFRRVNERYGQMIADEALVEIAVELKSVYERNLVARLNGDEFGILLRDVPDEETLTVLIAKYLALFERPFHTGDRDGTRLLSVSASLGCAFYAGNGQAPEDVMRCADVALEVAKSRGGGTAVRYDDSMARIIEHRYEITAGIASALANDEFRLMYQPTFDLQTRRLTGAEALIRWDHPERGELLPAAFIPIAEQHDLIGPITRWVLHRVAHDLDSASLPLNFRCFFNLSARDLDDFAFIGELGDVLGRHPQLSNMLGVEITETTAMQNVEQSLNTLGIIRGMGVHVAIDDFGTGYSSLSYLKRLAVDVVKIDQTFVAGLPADHRDSGLVAAMIAICGQFELVAHAEGIETEDQLAWLTSHGCRYGQGYLVSRPITFSDLAARLAS